MSLKDIFESHNPFQNLIVAGPSTVKFPLRGHEELLGKKFREIGEAIMNPDYPANAQHTIVFGEWGHGKTHVLRSIEHVVNTEYASRARAVFFEPTESDARGIFEELCGKLDIAASDPVEFIEKIQQNFPEHFFLLIDETQALVGEKLSRNYLMNLKDYWNMLDDIQQAATAKLYGLHVFHGLSLNSALEIYRLGEINTIKHFQHIFSLTSLDEEAQWRMICDHIYEFLDSNKIKTVQPENIIKPGVNRCIRELTGGVPRFALSLMQQIFSNAHRQGLSIIDGPICYQTLCEIPRFDSTGQNYFNRLVINDILAQLNDGQQFEKKISVMLREKIGTILGEWSSIAQATLSDYGLTTANIRRRCGSLKEPIVLFDQPRGEDYFRFSYDFLRLIQVKVENTLTKVDDKDLLLRLQLEPEGLISAMRAGIQQIMIHNNFPGRAITLQTSSPFKFYSTHLGGNRSTQNVRIGLTVYKGKQIPLDVFEKFAEEIEADRCAIIVFIEDVTIRHDFPESSYGIFKNSYSGNINLEKRFIFINGTDPNGQKFDEDFFVQLVKTSINSNEARNWFERLQINKRLKQVEDDFIYCPDTNEQVLLEELFKLDRSFNIREVHSLNESFNWVSTQRLEKLKLYLSKTGSRYKALEIEQIAPFKFILGTLQGTEIGYSTQEIENKLSAKYIRTGIPVSMNTYFEWVIRILEYQNKVFKKDNSDRIFFKDLDREFMKVKESFEKTLEQVEKVINKYVIAEIEESALKEVQEHKIDIQLRLDEHSGKLESQIDTLKDALKALGEIECKLEEIPNIARVTLSNQLHETNKKFEKIQRCACWPIKDLNNPYESLYHINKFKDTIEELEKLIQEDIPKQKSCRKKIQEINKSLSAFGDLLNGEIESGSYEFTEVDNCIFNLFNAIRDEKSGKVTLYF